VSVFQWANFAVAVATLLAIMLGGWKVVGIAERGVEDHRTRLSRVESDLSAMNLALIQVTAVKVEVSDMHKEIERMRDRLDKFLDSQAHRDAPPDSMSSVVELLTEVLKRKTLNPETKVSIEP